MAREGGVEAIAGEWSSMGANLAVEADASLRRCESDLRGGMMSIGGFSIPASSCFVLLSVYSPAAGRRAGLVGTVSLLLLELGRLFTRKCSDSMRGCWFEDVVLVNGSN